MDINEIILDKLKSIEIDVKGNAKVTVDINQNMLLMSNRLEQMIKDEGNRVLEECNKKIDSECESFKKEHAESRSMFNINNRRTDQRLTVIEHNQKEIKKTVETIENQQETQEHELHVIDEKNDKFFTTIKMSVAVSTGIGFALGILWKFFASLIKVGV